LVSANLTDAKPAEHHVLLRHLSYANGRRAPNNLRLNYVPMY